MKSSILASVLILEMGALHAQSWTVINLHPAGAASSRLNATTGTEQAGHVDLAVNAFRACIWSGSASSFQVVHPAAASKSILTGTTGSQQVGEATVGGQAHAGIWAGTSGSFIDLHPIGASESRAHAVNGAQRVGFATQNGVKHALLWTNAETIDLHPTGATESQAWATDGAHQAGYVSVNNVSHAAVWSGSAATFIDLHPLTATSSAIFGIAGAQQAGFVAFNNVNHAAIWSGRIGSFVDLHPSDATNSYLTATTGSQQVGNIIRGGQIHAGYWEGTAASFVDLHTLLPANFQTSDANAIWTDGITTLIAGSASTGFHDEAILWRLTNMPRVEVPTVTVSGKKNLVIRTPTFVLRGSATATGSTIARIEVKVGKAGFRRARGTFKWKFTTHLVPGKNRILVRAINAAGLISRPTHLTIFRQ